MFFRSMSNNYSWMEGRRSWTCRTNKVGNFILARGDRKYFDDDGGGYYELNRNDFLILFVSFMKWMVWFRRDGNG